MNRTRAQLCEILDELDRLVHSCRTGAISFAEFFKLYGYPVGEHALDGHASSTEEQNHLREFSQRIRIHTRIQNEVLHLVCLPEDATKSQYIEAGRISPTRAFEILKEIGRIDDD